MASWYVNSVIHVTVNFADDKVTGALYCLFAAQDNIVGRMTVLCACLENNFQGKYAIGRTIDEVMLHFQAQD